MTTLFWTVLFCLGWRIVTEEGMILYFIRKPFDKSFHRAEYLKELKKSLADVRMELLKHKLIVAIGKPFVLCITCMASIWGVSVFIALNGLNESLIIPLILNCFAAAFLQTFIWTIYDRISK